MTRNAALWILVTALALCLTADPSLAHGTATPDLPVTPDLKVYQVEIAVEGLQALRRDVDVWSYSPHTNRAVVLLDAEQKARLESQGFHPELDRRRTELHIRPLRDPAKTLGGGIPGFPCYRTVEETFDALSTAAAARPELAQWLDFGDSWLKTVGQGGFDQRVLVLTNQGIAGPKPVFVLMAAMHAREYATAEIATRFALHLLNGYGTDPEATWLLDHREIHVIPQQNPDGRKEAETGLSWRKNVNNDFCSNSNNRGIDLNRNSTFFWNGPASSGSQCSEIYRGPSAASEPETMSIEDYFEQVFIDQKGDMADPAPDDTEGVFISIHSFGELVLYPWEGTNNDGPNHAQLRTLGRKFGFLTDYTVCQDCLGTASGTTVDAAYGEYGVASYTFEVGTDFFQSCSAFESTIYPDNLQAMLYAAKVADLPYQKPSGPESITLQPSATSVVAGASLVIQATLDDSRFDSGGFGNEPTQNIAAGRAGFDLAALEAGGGTAMTALDGTFDEVSEGAEATLDTSGLAPGNHLLFVQGQDASGQWGPPNAVFVTVTDAIFADGFETGDTTRWSEFQP